MRHLKQGRKLNRTPAHRKAMWRNQCVSLFLHESIETTVPKAKQLRGVAEPLITLAKRGDLSARRQAFRYVQDRSILHKLFEEIAPRFRHRPGGYTRVLKSGFRRGDNAPLAIIQLLPQQSDLPAGKQASTTPKSSQDTGTAGLSSPTKETTSETSDK